MSLKTNLKAAGVMMIALAIIFMIADRPIKEEQSIWEEIPDEEVQTYIQQAEQTEDISEHGPIQEVEAGQCEEAPPAAGQITKEEEMLLQRIAEAEAGNQGADGMWLVMSVVMNRTESPDFPDSIEEVILQEHQFSSVTDGNYENVYVYSAESSEALERIKAGDIAPEIVAFEVNSSEELDKYFMAAFEYRDHRFYTAKSE